MDSIFNEAINAALLSASVFALADLRNLAHENVISGDEAKEILQLPMTRRRLNKLTQKYDKHVKKFKSRDFPSNADKYINYFSFPDSMVVNYIGDDGAREECVHYIGRSPDRGAIVLVYRGSATINDLRQDFKLMVAKVPNPIRGEEGQPDELGIHRGFRTFVCYGRKDEKTGKMEPSIYKGVSKLEVILNQLRVMKRQHPNDQIFITGHSLGGALGLITALAVCADPLLATISSDASPGHTPVICYGVGNPKPGDGDFCNAIEHLEKTKKLHCCVVHNTWDIIPMLSTNLLGSHSGFWHPGWRVLLYKDRCEIGRSRATNALLQEDAVNPQCSCSCCRCCCCRRQDSKAMWIGMPTGFNIDKAANNMTKERISKHNHRVYVQRLADQESHLRKIKLHDLYSVHM